MECILILTQIRLALVFFVIHKDIGSLFGVLGWKYILSKKTPGFNCFYNLCRGNREYYRKTFYTEVSARKKHLYF